LANQSDINNNSNNSRRNTNETIYNQEYASFFNDWRNVRYFQGKQNRMSQRNSIYENYHEYEQKNSVYEVKSFDIELNKVLDKRFIGFEENF